MKQSTTEQQEANYMIFLYLGMQWGDAVKLSQSDRAFLYERAVELKVDWDKQQKSKKFELPVGDDIQLPPQGKTSAPPWV